ncbi:autotransporter outer membrane beta-barrel domain-containing protein [Variovorax sp. WS11]|uniref:autotransporter outer membrane beta-barrel domain-containing protein n=1 Tax=Variovorax sp. WS11 TaxID=1105204 RepID=UPI001EF21444|nr:autotransporter outer membrane beta-barrel domain-containing protein [Variovorax sp. WS11]
MRARSTVQVVNLGGLGAPHQRQRHRARERPQWRHHHRAEHQDAFALQGGHVDAGAYEYRLQAGDAAGAGENWYLRSTSTIIPPAPPGTPAPPVPPAPGNLQHPRFRLPHRRLQPRPPSRCPLTVLKCLSSQPCPSSCARATWPCSATCISASATTM